jgi:hypothetical protein
MGRINELGQPRYSSDRLTAETQELVAKIIELEGEVEEIDALITANEVILQGIEAKIKKLHEVRVVLDHRHQLTLSRLWMPFIQARGARPDATSTAKMLMKTFASIAPRRDTPRTNAENHAARIHFAIFAGT